MTRLEIELTEEQHRELRQWAGRLGLTTAEAVLRCVTDRMTAVRAVTRWAPSATLSRRPPRTAR